MIMKTLHTIYSTFAKHNMASLRLLLVMLLTLTASTAWGKTQTYTLAKNDNGKTVTTDDVTWDIASGAIDESSSKCKLTGTITVSLPAGATLNSVTITGNGNSWGSGATITFNGNTTLYTFSSCSTYSLTKNKTDLTYSFVKSGTSSKNAWVKSITVDYTAAPSCSEKPTIGTELQSVTATENSIKATIPITAVGGCNITENGLVYSTTNSTPTVDGSGCTTVTTTACGSTAANKTVTITGLTCGKSYYIRGYATNAAGTSYTNVTTKSTSDCPKYTVTLKDDNSTLTQSTAGEVLTLPKREGCDGYEFVGWTKSWSVAQTTWTTTAPEIISAGEYTPTANESLYPVYTKTEGGGSEPTAYSAGDVGSFIIASNVGNKWYAIPENPTLSSSKITGVEITVSQTDGGVKYVSTANAEGYTWKIANATNGQTISDGSKYIYHSNGGASGTNLAYGTSTSYTWKIEKETNGLTFKGMSGSTTNSRGLLFNGSVFGGYALSNEDASGYYRIQVLPIGGGSTTYYISVPDCCTPLAEVTGLKYSNITSNSITVAVPDDYSDIANASGYTFNCYSALTGGTLIATADESGTSHTFTGLTKNTTYYFTVIAKGEGKYCNSIEISPRESSKTLAQYTVILNPNGGSGTFTGWTANGSNYTKTVDAGTQLTLPTLSKTGYDFAGWNDGTTTVTSPYTPTKDITLTAQWTAIEYTITYQETKGATNSNPATYTIEDAITFEALTDLPKGYNFTGWNPASIAKGTTGNQTVTAQWTEKPLTRYRTDCDACIPLDGYAEINGTYHFFPGETITLTVTPPADADPADCTYQWQKKVNSDYENIEGETGLTYTKENATTSDVGHYRCVVSSEGYCDLYPKYNVKCLQLYVYYDNKSDVFNTPLNRGAEENTATISVDLQNANYKYYFKITDGCGNWYGNTGTMVRDNCTNWSMDVNEYCGLQTTKFGTYVFNVNYSDLAHLTVSVIYPAALQEAGKEIYLDNNVLKWTYSNNADGTNKIYYRIGRSDHNNKIAMDLVPGTANLYKVTTSKYDNFDVWHIANNGCHSEFNSIFKTKTNDKWAATQATAFETLPVTLDAVTVTPTTLRSVGGDNNNNNCEFYNYDITEGMKTWNAKIVEPTNGTITVSYTHHDGTVVSDFTSGDRDLAHTCLLTITATPDAGYKLGTLTVNDVAFTSGNVHTLTEDTEIKVTWTEKETPTFAWSDATCTAALEADNTFPTLNNPNTLPVTYTSSNTDVATIDANGNITLVATGTTTITATGAETATHKSATDTYELTVVASNCRWVETDIANINSGDEVVITMCKGAFTWTISNAKNTSTAPTANDITDKIQGKYLTKVDNEYKWVIEKNNATLTFYSYSDNANYLYCTNADNGNGVRVGTGAAKVFVVDGNYLKNTQTTVPRYVGISFNTNPYSWRCYTDTTGVIANETLKFYKRECLDASKVWVEGNLTNVTCTPQLPQQLAKEGSITLTFTAAAGYALPTSVNVKMGATTLSTTSWDRGTGELTINAPTGGFTDNVLVTVEALQVKTVTFSVDSEDIAPTEMQAEENTDITLPAFTTNLTCVKFVGWTDADNDAAITSGNIYKAGDSYKVTQDITLKAVYAAGGGFVLVTDANDLAAGDHIVIAAAGFDVAMGADRGNNRGEVEVTKDNNDNTITTPDGIQILTLEAGTTTGSFAFSTGNSYLYAAGGTSSNYLKTTQTLDNKGSWNISISAEGIATIKSVEPIGDKARNWLRYNSTNTPPIFSCYASGQADVSIYKESVTGYTTDPECEEYDITLEVIGHANGSARINGQTATPTTSQTVTILNTEKATISNVANVAGYDVTVSKRSGNATFTDNGDGTWAVSEPASNVTIQVQYTAKQIYKVQFVTGTSGTGSFTSLDAYKGQTVTIPANYEAFGLCGEFVGWTEGARANGEKPTKLYQPGDPFTLNSNGTSLYAVYSISASCTSEFALGKSGDYEMYAIYSSKVYYATQKNGSNDYFYANTEADIEANARVKSTFRMQYDATQTAAWNEQDVYAYTIYISNGSTEYGFWHLNSVGDLDFDATEPYYWKVKSYNGGYDIYGEASGKTYHITCNSSNFNARTSAGEVYFTPGGGIEYWTDIDCSDINVDVTFAWNQFESWPVGMPNANSYKGLAKCSEITEFPVALQEGWTFLGWSTKEYNALHADDLDDENNASRAYPDGSDIYKTGGNTLTLGSADITLYPVFTRYEENEPLNLVNGGEFYMYVKPGNTDVYGGVRRFYIADVNLSSGGFTSTEDCNDARPFTFIKEDAGWLIQFVDEGGKTYYLGANAADSDLTKHQTSKTYWDITVGAGNNPANAYRMMAIGQGSDDALLAKFSNGLTSATFKYYAIENLINTPSVYFDIFLGSCEDRVFSSDPTSKPSVTITGGGYVTGSKGQTVFVPSAFTITGKNLNDNYNVNISDVGGLLKFYNEAGNVISNFGKPLGGKLAQTTFYVAYTPTADTDGTEIPSIIVTNGTGGSALNQEITDLIHARHLPAEFAIVAKIGGNWYALPDTALHVQTPEGLLVEVDNVDNPTAVTQSFCNATAWSLRGVKNTRYVVNSVLNGDNVLFAETNTEVIDNRKMLYAGEDSKVGAYATYTNYTATNPDRYEWQLTTTDNITYTVNSNSTIVSDPLSVNNSRAFGTHGKFVASEEIRLLPIEGPCIAPAVFQVIEWKTNGMIIMYTGAGVSATTQVGTYAASDAKMTEVDHGVYELTTNQDLTACTGLKLAITFTDASSNKTQKVLVIPAIVSGEKGSTSLVASDAVAKVTDVVVLDDAKLTADGTQYTYNDVVVYPGGNLVIDTDGKLGMYTLTLRAGSSWGAEKYENKYPQFLLKGVYSNSSGQINLDYVTTQDYYYPLSVPEEVTIGDIKYPVDIYGNNVKANNTGSFQLKYYDGAQRATGATGWVVLDEKNITKLSPNSGYAFWGIPKKVSVNGAAGVRQTYGIHRIPIKIAADKLLDHEKINEEITIQAYAAARPNDQGWNYLGNPYFAGLGSMDDSDEDLLIGLLEKEIVDGQWTGGWVYNEESVNNKVRYITITNDCQNFEALPVANAKISPFTTFFIQAASVDDQKIRLTAPASVLNVSSLPARHYAAQQEAAKEITTGILLSGNDQTDRTGLLIADNFTEEYDFNADLSKFENSGVNLYTIGKTGNLAYMAINQALAEQPIPVGYSAPAEGLYTIAFDEDRYNATDISALYLIDYDSNEKTNLLHTDYSFVTAAGTNNQRFALQVAFAPENATNVEWVGDATIQVGVEGHELILNNLPIDAAVHVFDALGRLMYHTPHAPTEMQLTLPTGYYLVRIADKQHAAVINTVIP